MSLGMKGVVPSARTLMLGDTKAIDGFVIVKEKEYFVPASKV